MAAIALTSPFNMKAATLEIDVDDYSAALSEVRFNPSFTTSTFTAINGSVTQDVSKATWTATLTGAQDLAPTGLLRYLLAHQGEVKDVTFTPKADGPAVEATIILAPGAIGGAAGADLATFSVTLPLNGEPEFIDPTP